MTCFFKFVTIFLFGKIHYLIDLLNCVTYIQVNTARADAINLENDLKDRERRWKQQLKTSSKEVKQKFDEYLMKKGHSGTIKFDHDEGTLHIEV